MAGAGRQGGDVHEGHVSGGREAVAIAVHTPNVQDMFDFDDALVYEPCQTAALVLTGGDEEAEAAALEVCGADRCTDVSRHTGVPCGGD